jgi:hypothetical protein
MTRFGSRRHKKKLYDKLIRFFLIRPSKGSDIVLLLCVVACKVLEDFLIITFIVYILICPTDKSWFLYLLSFLFVLLLFLRGC